MAKIDLFTSRRLLKFIADFRLKTGQLPTFKDLAEANFPKDFVEQALKEKLLESYYITLTNGAIVKGFKPASD